MSSSLASINDLPITAADRKFHWPAPGPGPADHPDLSELNLSLRSRLFCTVRALAHMNALPPARACERA